MSREKQIEEMARILNKSNGLDDRPAWWNDFLPDAEALYNAGYRQVDSVTFMGGIIEQLKAEAAKEIFADIEEAGGVYETPFNTYITIREQKYNALKKKHIERRKI